MKTAGVATATAVTLKINDQYKKAVALAETAMQQITRVQVVRREFLPNFIFGEKDTVVVLG